MSKNAERLPQQPLRLTAREVSVARQIRREAIDMLGPRAHLDGLPQELRNGLQADKRISALISLCHVLGTIGGIEFDLLRQNIDEKLGSEPQPADTPLLRPVGEIQEAERRLREQVEHPDHQIEELAVQQLEELVAHPNRRLSSLDERAVNLFLAMRGEGKIDAYDFMLGEDNWIWDIIRG